MSGETQYIPSEVVADWRSITALIESTNERQPVPCRSGDIVPVGYWTSDDPVEAVLAAQACAHCPLKAACLAYGLEHPKEAGIYGGMGPKQRTIKPPMMDAPPNIHDPVPRVHTRACEKTP